MRNLNFGLGLRSSLVGASFLVLTMGFGCSDDDDDTDSSQGGSPSTGGKPSGGKAGFGGSAGGTIEAGAGGSDGGGARSDADDAGSDAGGASGAWAGGSDGGGARSDAGSGGGGMSGESPAEISKVFDTVLTGVNDLRGLVYSSDGTKIYASGHTDITPNERQLAIVRLNADGTLDDTFSGDGILEVDAADGDEQSTGIVELENGDLIVQANLTDQNGGDPITDLGGGPAEPRPSGQDVMLLRFTSSGAPVTTFGDNGRKLIDFGWTEADNATWPVPTFDSRLTGNARWSGAGFPSDTSWGISLDTSGSEERIVVFGFGPAPKISSGTQRFDNDRYVVRVLASTGAVDPSFNGGAPHVFNSLGTFSDGARRGLVEEGGAIVSTGYTNFGAGLGNHVVMIRLLPNGTSDPNFGFGIAVSGATRFNPFIGDGGFAECYSVAQQASGRYVTTGYGRATADGIASEFNYATSTAQDLVSFGVLPGGLDPSYGIQGNLAIQSEEANLGNTEDRGRDLVVLRDDRVVHAGRFGPNPALFVTTKDGALDLSAGDASDGIFAYTPLTASTSHFYKLALSPDGTRIAATTSHHDSGVILAILGVEAEQ